MVLAWSSWYSWWLRSWWSSRCGGRVVLLLVGVLVVLECLGRCGRGRPGRGRPGRGRPGRPVLVVVVIVVVVVIEVIVAVSWLSRSSSSTQQYPPSGRPQYTPRPQKFCKTAKTHSGAMSSKRSLTTLTTRHQKDVPTLPLHTLEALLGEFTADEQNLFQQLRCAYNRECVFTK